MMDPLSNKTKETTPFSKIEKKETSKKEEKTDNLSQKLFDQMQDIKGEDSNDSLSTRITQKLVENRIPIPPDSPFADTDIIIFKDDYSGYIPPNGIRKNDFEKISQIYNSISKGQANLDINQRDPVFKNEVLLCIKTLMTREIGRKLINTFINLPSYCQISPGKENATDFNNIQLNITPNSSQIFLHPSGKLSQTSKPLFLSFGHELIHIIHRAKGVIDISLELDEEDADYHNMEEKRTITGFKQKVIGPTEAPDENNWSPITHDYDELNERALTAAFTGSLTEFFSKHEIKRFPRVGHLGLDIDIDTKPLGEKLKQFVGVGVTYDLEKLIKETPVTKDTLNSLFKPGELHALAIKHGRVDVLKLLLKVDSDPEINEEENLLHLVAKEAKKLTNSKLHLIIDAILESEINVNRPDLQGNTPCHCFMALGDGEAVKKLINKGADIHIKNEYSLKDPVSYALSRILGKSSSKKTDTGLQSELHALRQLMKEIYPKDKLIQKLTEPAFAASFFGFGDQESILDCLDILHESGYDLSKLDAKGNSIMHYAVLSRQTAVVDKLKNQYKLDMNIKNQKGQSLTDYLISQIPNLFNNRSSISVKDGKLIFDTIYDTLKTLEVDMDPYKKPILLACEKIEGLSFEKYVKTLFKIDNPL